MLIKKTIYNCESLNDDISKKNLEIEYPSVCPMCHKSGDPSYLSSYYIDDEHTSPNLFIHYKLNNKSQLPISVTDIQLVLNGIEYTEDYNTHEVNSYHHKAKGVDEYVPTYNEHLPINLECLHSHSGYLVFVIPEDNSPNLDKGLTFQIRTNRNKEVQKKVSLNEVVTLRSTLPYQKYKNLFLKDKAEHKVH